MTAEVTYAQLEIDAVSGKRLQRSAWNTIACHSVILTKGTFDILHAGHLALFAHCARLRNQANASAVVVAVESDASVRSRKGPERPYQNEEARALQLSLLPTIDYVTIVATGDLATLLERWQPLVYLKGMDTALESGQGAEKNVALSLNTNPELSVLTAETRVVIFADDGTLSTSSIVRRIIERSE